MQDFILNIDNKEILIEVRFINNTFIFSQLKLICIYSAQILHHAVDHLIDSPKSHRFASTKFSHKFGFANPDEFESAIRFIADAYRRFTLKQLSNTEMMVKFAHLNADLQQSVVDVIRTRLTEVQEWLLVEHNSRETALVQSFDWDVKMVMGSSSMASIRQLLVTLDLKCRPEEGADRSDRSIFFEMDRAKLQKLIATLEESMRQMDERKVNINNTLR